jgi:hypothetical protein
MNLRIHTNQIWTRVLGSVTGVGFLAIGTFALAGSFAHHGIVAERAFGFGLAAVLAGVWAILVSWLDADLSGVWCRAPSRALRRHRAPPQEHGIERRKRT